MKHRKIVVVLFAAMMLMGIFAGCASAKDNAPAEKTAVTKETDAKQTVEKETKEPKETEEEKSEQAKEIEKDEETLTETEKTTQKQADKTKSSDTAQKSAASKSTSPRIIATSPAACDIMDRLGIDLVGVPSSSSSIAARYQNVTQIGSAMSPDMEIIKSLHPTDVIGPDTLKADLQMQYENIGVNATFINLRSVKGLYDSVQQIGEKYGKSAEAAAIVQEYRDFMASYSAKHSGESPKVLVLMGLPGSYLVATNNSYAGSLVELAGGTNIFHDTKDFLTISPEEMLARDPDVIIRTAHGLPKEAQAMFAKEFSTNDIWKHFRAVQEGRVYDVDYTLFGMSATFDYPQALADLEPMLYGN